VVQHTTRQIESLGLSVDGRRCYLWL